MANASKKGGGMGGGGSVGHQTAGSVDPSTLDEHDLANEIHGANRLQGGDQERVRNQRLTQPGSLDRDNQPTNAPAPYRGDEPEPDGDDKDGGN